MPLLNAAGANVKLVSSRQLVVRVRAVFVIFMWGVLLYECETWTIISGHLQNALTLSRPGVCGRSYIHTLASPRGQRGAVARPTGPRLDPEIRANPMRRVSA